METKQTAMQLAIQHYEDLSLKGSNQAYVVAEFLKKNFLPLEKEQIMDDFQAGKWDWAEHIDGKHSKDPAEYYNETYNK
jgi:hypothetical protein